MLTLTVPSQEFWDEKRQLFLSTKEETLLLEHSLLSISKWESKWHKPFFQSLNDMSNDEFIDYVRCMSVNKKIDSNSFLFMTRDNMDSITNYINDPMTASWFNEKKGPVGRRSSEVITSELIYCWMTQLNIPFECERWHLNRLMVLIRICSIKNAPPEKQSRRETLNQYAALNKMRKAKHGGRG